MLPLYDLILIKIFSSGNIKKMCHYGAVLEGAFFGFKKYIFLCSTLGKHLLS